MVCRGMSSIRIGIRSRFFNDFIKNHKKVSDLDENHKRVSDLDENH